MSHAVADAKGVLVTCVSCGQRNRVPYSAVAKASKCGACKEAIQGTGFVIEVTEAVAFNALIRLSALPVFVDFWAPWCGPCKMAGPEVEKTAVAGLREFLVAKVNTEELPQIGGAHGIQSLPTFVLFMGGGEVGRMSGVRPAGQLISVVMETIRAPVK